MAVQGRPTSSRLPMGRERPRLRANCCAAHPSSLTGGDPVAFASDAGSSHQMRTLVESGDPLGAIGQLSPRRATC
jgi:hypothetical protein